MTRNMTRNELTAMALLIIGATYGAVHLLPDVDVLKGCVVGIGLPWAGYLVGLGKGRASATILFRGNAALPDAIDAVRKAWGNGDPDATIHFDWTGSTTDEDRP